MKPSKVSEELLTISQVIGESEILRDWFVNLAALPPAIRAKACADMASSMAADGDDSDLIAAVSSLARPDIYNAVLQTLRN